MRDYIEYLQIPYLHQGRSTRGADCFGLLRLLYEKELHVTLPDFTEDYPQEWWKEKNYFMDLYKSYHFKRVKDVRPYDLIMFKNSATAVGHVGIVLDDSNFIHMTLAGCCVSNYLYGAWQKQIHSIYRYAKPRTRNVNKVL